MKIAVVIPTLNRTELLKKTLISLENSTYKDIYAIIVATKEDVKTLEMLKGLKLRFEVLLEFDVGKTSTTAFNTGFKSAGNDAIITANDDLIFEKDCIKQAVRAMKRVFPDGDGLIGFNQQHDGKKYARRDAFCLAGAKFVKRFPRNCLYCPNYTHFYVDEELGDFARSKDRFYYCEDAVVEHLQVRDETTKKDLPAWATDTQLHNERVKLGLLWGHNFELIELQKLQSVFKKIACCMPLSWKFMPSDAFVSYVNMMQYAYNEYSLLLYVGKGCFLDSVRDKLIKRALEDNPDYILTMDADELYPANLPEVLMRHIDSGKLVVGGVVPRKAERSPSVYSFIDSDTSFGARNDEIRLNQGLIKTDAMGLGGVMIHPKVFTELLKPPYFDMYWDKEKNARIGEDFRFYDKCKKAGIDVWCDTNLICDHIDTQPVGFDKKYYGRI